MTATLELLEALRASEGGITDYRVAKVLGVSQAAVSRWRTGRQGMDDALAVQVCARLGLDPAAYLPRLAAERSQSEAVRSVWERIASSSSAAAVAALLLGVGAVMLSVDDVIGAQGMDGAGAVYITLSGLCLGWILIHTWYRWRSID